jgi:hypothetical protein
VLAAFRGRHRPLPHRPTRHPPSTVYRTDAPYTPGLRLARGLRGAAGGQPSRPRPTASHTDELGIRLPKVRPPDQRRACWKQGRRNELACDLDAEIERLRAAELPFRSDLVAGPGGRQILVADPAGNLIELFQPAHNTGTPTPATT